MNCFKVNILMKLICRKFGSEIFQETCETMPQNCEIPFYPKMTTKGLM